MVMEWVEGRLLRNIIHDKKKLPPERAIKIAVEICDASITSTATASSTAT